MRRALDAEQEKAVEKSKRDEAAAANEREGALRYEQQVRSALAKVEESRQEKERKAVQQAAIVTGKQIGRAHV